MGRFLLIEAQRDVAGIIKLMSAVGNHGTKEVSNSTDALKCFRSKRHFDLVIVGNRPKIGSDTLPMQLKEIRPKVPIIQITSGNVQLEHGADFVLPTINSLTGFLEDIDSQIKKP